MFREDPPLCLEGLAVDDLTAAFLRLATAPEESQKVHDAISPFFRDSRTRLNDLKVGLYLARRSASVPTEAVWNEIQRNYQNLELLIERVQHICSPHEIHPEPTDLDLLLTQRKVAWKSWLEAGAHPVDWLPPDSPVVTSCDASWLAEGLDAFAEWRAAESPYGSRIRIAWWKDATSAHLIWEEVPGREAFRLCSLELFESPLALPMLARVVTAHKGRMHFLATDGIRLELEWPCQSVARLIMANQRTENSRVLVESEQTRP